MWAEPKPTMIPRAKGSQYGDCTAFQYGTVSRPSAPSGTLAAAASSSGSILPSSAGSPSSLRNQLSSTEPEFCTISSTYWPGIPASSVR